MVRRDSCGDTHSKKTILPVVVPAAFLLFLTVSVRTYTFLTIPRDAVRTNEQTASSFSQGINTTEATFAKYAVALETLSSNEKIMGRDEEMALLSEMGALTHEPISMDGNTFQNPKLCHFSPQTVLLSVSQRLATRAKAAAKNGDYLLARKYIDVLYGIGEHVLSASSLSLQGLKSAHHLLGFAARVQVSVFGRNDYAGAAARYREWALTTLWQERIWPQIESEKPSDNNKVHKALATVLAKEYREGWSQIRAGEA